MKTLGISPFDGRSHQLQIPLEIVKSIAEQNDELCPNALKIIPVDCEGKIVNKETNNE